MNRRGALILGAAVAIVRTAVAGAGPVSIVVSDAWSRPAIGEGVVYMTLTNHGATADRLVGASSPAANRVSLHQSFATAASPAPAAMAGMTMPMPMGGAVMSMRSLTAIPVPAHGTALLAPGGYHLMLELRHDLRAGSTIPLRLHFARAGWLTTSVHVRPVR